MPGAAIRLSQDLTHIQGRGPYVAIVATSTQGRAQTHFLLHTCHVVRWLGILTSFLKTVQSRNALLAM